ncbi:hypothetical protein Aperf_G00000105719 [Anoplocephala perfoliata]
MNGLIPRESGCTCDKIPYFNRKCAVDALTGLTLVCDSLPAEYAPFIPNSPDTKVPYSSKMDRYSCSYCKLSFANVDEQKAHFKSSGHVAVIGKNILRPVCNGKLYETWSESDSDSSSDSTQSDSEIEVERQITERKSPERKKGVVGSLALFRNRNQEIIGIHRCLIRSQEAPVRYFDDVLSRIDLLRTSRFWAFLLYSGGKFAGAIFDEDRVVVHKTFHRYTVRAKQGGSQFARDGALGGMSGHKSAGSTLRRHGEVAIRAASELSTPSYPQGLGRVANLIHSMIAASHDIANLLHVKWRVYMQACQLVLTMTARRNRSIFTTPPSSYGAPGSSTSVEGNNGHSSGGDDGDKEPILAAGPDSQAAYAVTAKMGVVSGDPRLRRLSGGARRISYAHIRELQAEFSRFRIYEPHSDLRLIALSDRRQMEEGSSMVFESKSGRFYYGRLNELMKITSSASKSQPVLPSDSNPVSVETSAPTSKKQKKLRQKKNRQKRLERNVNQPASSAESSGSKRSGSSSDEASTQRADEWMNKAPPAKPNPPSPDRASLNTTYAKWMQLVCMATANGDTEELVQLLNVSNPASGCSRNVEFPPDEETLHILLNSVQLRYGTTPLHTAVELGDEPDVLDILLNAGCRLEEKDSNGMTAYQLAGKIGKRKLTAHFKKLRTLYPDRYDYTKAGFPPLQPTTNNHGSMRKKKQAVSQTTTEEAAQILDRMSMREKCASAAERRAAQNQQKGKPRITCNQCSADMTGKDPFSYLNFVFCSAECMRKHRQQQNRR